jgi:hypothetical protein
LRAGGGMGIAFGDCLSPDLDDLDDVDDFILVCWRLI